MPVPKPKDGEEQKDYISRCMGDETMVKEYEQDQRAAICYATWKKKDKLAEQLADVQDLNELLSEVKDGLVRIAIAYTGDDFERNDGKKFSISLDDLKQMQRNMKGREIPLDYEHLSAQTDAPPGHSRASGWIKKPDKIETLPGGRQVLWGWAEFTPACLTAIRQKEYRYFSPEIHWNSMNERGKVIGTRLAAGAITNRPFLKDLPPIEIAANDYSGLLEAVALSELERMIDVQDVHVPGDMNQQLKGDQVKNLKIKKIDDGDDKGKVGIFDGDSLLGCIPQASMKTLADELLAAELAELAEFKKVSPADKAELEEFRALKAKANVPKDAKAGDLKIYHKADGSKTEVEDDDGDKEELKSLKKLIEQGETKKAESVCLVEFSKAKPGDESMTLAEKLLGDGKLTMSGYLRAQKIERLVDGAIAKGKILPRQREQIYRLAINDFDATQAFLNEAKAVIDLQERGIAGNSDTDAGGDAKAELDQAIKGYMTENKCAYAEALSAVSKRNPTLWTRYQQRTVVMAEGRHPDN